MTDPTSMHKLKHRVFTCLAKLSDRDTYSVASTELETIARSLEPISLSTFLSCIHSTDAADKSPVRKQCVHLLAVLSKTHGNTLSPHLSKMLSAIIRRLRDPDSAVRSACVNTTAALSSHITNPSFSSFLKPLADALFTEQDQNSQTGAALCLAAAIDAAPDPKPTLLMKFLPRFQKLLKSEGFSAKAAVLILIGSIIEVGGTANNVVLRALVPCVVEFLSKESWAARKAAAEALLKLAVAQRVSLAEFKEGCLKVFEDRKCDKVKAVREVMNQLVEAWKQVPDISDEISLPLESHDSCREDGNDGYNQPRSRHSFTDGPGASQLRKKYVPANGSTPPEGSFDTTARKRSPLKTGEKKSSPAMFRKLGHKKPSGRNVEIDVSHAPSSVGVTEGALKERDESARDIRNNETHDFSKPETRRALFRNYDDKIDKLGSIQSEVCAVPGQHQHSSEVAGAAQFMNEDLHNNHKECEDLSLIRKQLVQIEQQQSSLLDLIQKFMGSSQHGMHSLESRVHGIELALDAMSYDFAVTSGRMGGTDSSGTMCCRLPGADFLSSKFWKKDGRGFSVAGATPSLIPMRLRANGNNMAETRKMDNQRLRLQGSRGFIVNPLAETHSNSKGDIGHAHE